MANKTYSVGQKFKANGYEYILSAVGFNDSDGIAIRLVNLESGTYIGSPNFYFVQEPRKITQDQFQVLAGKNYKDYKLIS